MVGALAVVACPHYRARYRRVTRIVRPQRSVLYHTKYQYMTWSNPRRDIHQIAYQKGVTIYLFFEPGHTYMQTDVMLDYYVPFFKRSKKVIDLSLLCSTLLT